MSVVVKGMRMPENCSECPVALSGKYCRINKTNETYRMLPFRPDHCPLVDLGKHGDLIDKNSLKETFDYYISEAGWGEEINKALGWVKDDFINSEPTVIEAEDGS